MSETEGAAAQTAEGNGGATSDTREATLTSRLQHTMILPVEGRGPMSVTISCENGQLTTMTARDASGAEFAVMLHLRPVNLTQPALTDGSTTGGGTNGGEGDPELGGEECVECTTDANGISVCRPVRCD